MTIIELAALRDRILPVMSVPSIIESVVINRDSTYTATVWFFPADGGPSLIVGSGASIPAALRDAEVKRMQEAA